MLLSAHYPAFKRAMADPEGWARPLDEMGAEFDRIWPAALTFISLADIRLVDVGFGWDYQSLVNGTRVLEGPATTRAEPPSDWEREVYRFLTGEEWPSWWKRLLKRWRLL